MLNNLPVRDSDLVRNHWTEIGSQGYDHVYVSSKSELSADQLASSFNNLPWVKSALIHKDLYTDTELKKLERRFPEIEFQLATLLAGK